MEIKTMLAVVACLGAAGVGWCAWAFYADYAQHAYRKRALAKASVHGGSAGQVGSGRLKERSVALAMDLSHRIRLRAARSFLPRSDRPPPRFERTLLLAGLHDEISCAGYRECRLRLALLGGVLGGCLGCSISWELAGVLACAGAVGGWRLLPSALKERIAFRARDLERHLPEMLDVIALGMRSGLSFDGALALYERYFDTLLARSFRTAQQQWSCGLRRRDEALRAIADTYDSFLFKRVIDNVIRSLRFGTSLAENLDDVAHEARADYKARRQEQVAKVPIKMMLPTGALMLPAMLILVLGPVLLELAGNIS